MARAILRSETAAAWVRMLILAFAAALQVWRGWSWLQLRSLWAEDGIWWADQYHHGWRALLLPHTGYMQELPRLLALVEVHSLPLHRAPLASFAAATALGLVPAAYLLSDRTRHLCPSFPVRAALALLTIAIPAAIESVGNVTNLQWRFAVAALVVVLAEWPRRRLLQAVDLAGLTIAGLTGPFVIPLGVAAAAWWCTGGRRPVPAKAAVLAVCMAVQGVALTVARATRPGPPIGASWDLAARIAARAVAVGTVGDGGFTWVAGLPAWRSWLPWALAAAGVGLAAYATWKGPAPLRLALAYGAAIFAATLVAPVGPPNSEPWWAQLTAPYGGDRYFYPIGVAWAALLLLLLTRPRLLLLRTGAAAALAALVLVGMRLDWCVPAYPDVGFQAAARAFEAGPVGSTFTIPLEPPSWSGVELVRH